VATNSGSSMSVPAAITAAVARALPSARIVP
jgi:hypothetical protein